MDRHYSTLELFKHDETARAPERDYDATTFELDASALAPEVIPDITPQVLYDSSFPEAHGKTEAFTEERASTYHITKAALKWLWMVVALLVAAAIAIGVGVGTWRHREHSSKKQISPPVPQNDNVTPAAGHILNDTSLAAMILLNGDRQLYFQDNSGSIRRAVRTASDNQWGIGLLWNASTELSNWKIPKPKKYTPLATAPSYSNIHEKKLYYVSENHHLTSIFQNPYESTYREPVLKNYTTVVDTRSLSVASLITGNRSIDTGSTRPVAILYYENPTGQVSALILRNNLTFDLAWIDITSQSSQSLPGDLRNDPNPDVSSKTLYESARNDTFSPPFATGTAIYQDILGEVEAAATFYSPLHDCILYTTYSFYVNDSRFQTRPTPGCADMTNPNQDNVTIRQSDFAMIGVGSFIWINGTQPAMSLSDPPPDSSFPFTRLASVNSADLSSTFLYHQINDTTFAEEQWDFSSRVWLPTEYIIVPDS